MILGMSEIVKGVENIPLEKATFGMGCFWCGEAIFSQIEGVLAVEPGYAGGTKPNPTYQEVCQGSTGYIEVTRITYDPSRVRFSQLLEVFFRMHDPTSVDQQGADRGEQYRSVVFYENEEQRATTLEAIARLEQEGVYREKIVTQVEPVKHYYPAEAYHKNYFATHPREGYCRMVIAPKVEKFREVFRSLLKEK